MFVTYEKFIRGVMHLKPSLDKSDAKKFLIHLIVCLVSIVTALTWMFFKVFEKEIVILVGVLVGIFVVAQTLRSVLDDIEYLDIWYSVSRLWILFLAFSSLGSIALWYFF